MWTYFRFIEFILEKQEKLQIGQENGLLVTCLLPTPRSKFWDIIEPIGDTDAVWRRSGKNMTYCRFLSINQKTLVELNKFLLNQGEYFIISIGWCSIIQLTTNLKEIWFKILKTLFFQVYGQLDDRTPTYAAFKMFRLASNHILAEEIFPIRPTVYDLTPKTDIRPRFFLFGAKRRPNRVHNRLEWHIQISAEESSTFHWKIFFLVRFLSSSSFLINKSKICYQ